MLSLSLPKVCYTQNTQDSLEIARKHFAASLKLNPNNLRSLYGLHQSACSLIKHPKIKKEAKIKNEDILQWTSSQLLECYQVLDQITVISIDISSYYRIIQNISK